ncbi:MAG: IclR family transcriptional regulator [Oscillospiraceae bacterium]|jgi:DNA-binding IclR family transcriptional regulator|nr:IclR family transcriptional regulator [Oscillospiraceae bacterium]
MTNGNQGQSGIQSISRAANILRCFYNEPALRLTDISRIVGLHKSTAAGILNTLKNEGLLEQDEPGGKFRLGLELFTIAMRARGDLADICEPYLNRLLELTGETVNLAVLNKTDIVYIAKKESSHSIRIGTSVGKRLPVYCAANGKAILAFLDEEKKLELIDRLEFHPFTANTITDMDRLLAELEAIRVEGIAYDLEEYEDGVICVAIPLLSATGNPIGAISISGPQMRMDEVTRAEYAQHLREITSHIDVELARLS